MLPDSTTRGWHLDQLRKGLRILSDLIQTVTPAAATTYRDAGTGWTATEVMCHLRDAEQTFLERAQQTVTNPGGSVSSQNQDEMAQERRYNEQSLPVVYGEWAEKRQAFLAFLESVDDSAWSQISVHPRRGPMTLANQLALAAWHDVNHIEQMTRTLNEQKTK